MTVPAKRTICLLVSTVFLITSCASVMTVSYRGIPEKDIGEISFIAADEETGRLVTGIVVDVYRQGEKKPFRTFLTDERGPIQLTNLPPGKYTIRASKYVDHRGKHRSISGDTSTVVSVKAGKCNEITQVLRSNGDDVVAVLIVVTVVALVVLVLLAAMSGRSSGLSGLPFFVPAPGSDKSSIDVRSRKFQRRHHRRYSYEPEFYEQVDLDAPPPPRGRAIIMQRSARASPTIELLSPDMPLILFTEPTSWRTTVGDDYITIEGKAKSVRGIREVRVEGKTAYRVPPAEDDDDPVREIEFSHTYKRLKPGKNLLRIKAIDVLDFSAEAYLLVARPDVPE